MDENIEKWSKKVVQYSVNTHSHLETLKSKRNPKEEEEKSSLSDEDSIVKNELSPSLGEKMNSDKKNDKVCCESDSTIDKA